MKTVGWPDYWNSTVEAQLNEGSCVSLEVACDAAL